MDMMASGQQTANLGTAVSRERTKPEHSTPDGSNIDLVHTYYSQASPRMH